LVRRESSPAEAKQVVSAAQSDYHKVLIQDHITGAKATVNLLYQNGQLLAESMALASHEKPHQGGLTSLRKSWWQQEMYEDTVCRLRFLNWDGPAMVEYKWDASAQKFTFIELNSRYWAALNLDILADLHFPSIHLDYFLHQKQAAEIPRFTGQITVRNALPADFGYLISKVKDSNVPLMEKIVSTLGFLLLPFHPGIKADLFYPGDRKLYFLNFIRFSKEFALAVGRRLGLQQVKKGDD
jgi:predicted ATP-grasp superfamily ATP-dependent carboligase